MATSPEQIAKLEWANYAAMVSSAQVTPGLDVLLRGDAILTSSTSFPTHDSNHACLLRTSAQEVDDLIAEVTGFYRTKGLPVAIYVSPACQPGDLSQRLIEAGFAEQSEKESWMVLENLRGFDMPSPYPGIQVRPIGRDEATVFAEVFMAAFGMPSDFAPIMAQLLRPSVGLEDVRHYLAFDQEKPIGTCSLLCHGGFGVLGSTGVISEQRGKGGATSLAVRAATDARELGVDTLMLQTAADTWLERFLRISGFRRAFSRSCYVLDDGCPD